MQTKKGYVGLIFLIVGLAFILYWFVYLWNNNWLSGRLNISSDPLNSDATTLENQPPKAINEQLNDLRKDVKNLQDKRDQEIMNELNAK